METIEEMFDYFITVVKFANPKLSEEEIESIKDLYTTGAKHREQVLTEWHDTKKELPPIGVPVLLKVKCDNEQILYVASIRTINPILGDGWGDGGGILDEQFTKVLGWREIHE